MKKPKPEGIRIVERLRQLSELKPHPQNARQHPPEEIEQLKGLIREFGWTSRIVIDEGDVILAGHARRIAGLELGHAEAPTLQIFGLTDGQKVRLMLADNRVPMNATWDQDALRVHLLQLQGDGTDLEALGFSAAEVDKLKPAEIAAAVEAVDLSTVSDRFWISVRGPLASQAEAFQQLKTVMASVPGVTVEQGTVMVADG